MNKHFEIFKQSDHNAKRQSEIGSRNAEWRSECELMIFNALGSARPDEVNVWHEDGDPG